MKYIVEYQFTDTLEIIQKQFTDFISAMSFQASVLKKYKNKLNYCIYKQEEKKMQETIFYMGLQVSKQFELEKEFLTIDNYYECILYLTEDYFRKNYNTKNMGLLESIDNYIDENIILIENNLVKYNVSETKKWGCKQ